MNDIIDISKISKAELLASLFNASKQQGMGFLDISGASNMNLEDAETIVSETTYFDYLRGRVLKVDIGGDTLAPGLYDRDNGQGAAARVVDAIRSASK